MTTSFRNRALAIWKLGLSFRKRAWELPDYPVVVKEQLVEPALQGSRLKPQRYMAFIVNWGLAGTGDTKQGALSDLQSKFATVRTQRREKQQPLPRPGISVPVQFASSQRVDVHPELAVDFVHRVLQLEWAWISDESSLWDFHENDTNDALVSRIKDVYGVDVSDIASARLWEIFDRIATAQTRS